MASSAELLALRQKISSDKYSFAQNRTQYLLTLRKALREKQITSSEFKQMQHEFSQISRQYNVAAVSRLVEAKHKDFSSDKPASVQLSTPQIEQVKQGATTYKSPLLQAQRAATLEKERLAIIEENRKIYDPNYQDQEQQKDKPILTVEPVTKAATGAQIGIRGALPRFSAMADITRQKVDVYAGKPKVITEEKKVLRIFDKEINVTDVIKSPPAEKVLKFGKALLEPVKAPFTDFAVKTTIEAQRELLSYGGKAGEALGDVGGNFASEAYKTVKTPITWVTQGVFTGIGATGAGAKVLGSKGFQIGLGTAVAGGITYDVATAESKLETLGADLGRVAGFYAVGAGVRAAASLPSEAKPHITDLKKSINYQISKFKFNIKGSDKAFSASQKESVVNQLNKIYDKDAKIFEVNIDTDRGKPFIEILKAREDGKIIGSRKFFDIGKKGASNLITIQKPKTTGYRPSIEKSVYYPSERYTPVLKTDLAPELTTTQKTNLFFLPTVSLDTIQKTSVVSGLTGKIKTELDLKPISAQSAAVASIVIPKVNIDIAQKPEQAVGLDVGQIPEQIAGQDVEQIPIQIPEQITEPIAPVIQIPEILKGKPPTVKPPIKPPIKFKIPEFEPEIKRKYKPRSFKTFKYPSYYNPTIYATQAGLSAPRLTKAIKLGATTGLGLRPVITKKKKKKRRSLF